MTFSVNNIRPHHLPAAHGQLSNLNSGSDISALVHLNTQPLSPSNDNELQTANGQVNGPKLTVTKITEPQWPAIQTCEAITHLVIGSNEDLAIDNTNEPIQDLSILPYFPNLTRLSLYQCTSLQNISKIAGLSRLQVLKFKNSFSGHCFTKSGLIGMYSDIVDNGILITGFTDEKERTLK